MRHTRRSFLLLAIALALSAGAVAQDLTLPLRQNSIRFAVMGDTGTGGSDQYRVAERLAAVRARFPFEFALMMGDNLYGGESARDFQRKFERPYKPLIDAGVKFYASLGNHDNPNQRFYKPFNMNGERYYTFKPKGGVRFFILDSNYMDKVQVQWLEKELAASGSEWKIAYFHHPLYSSGQHGSHLELRDQLEPLFLKYGVDLVLAGHEHFYERIKPQKGIHYFISGGAAKVRRGDIGNDGLLEKGFDQGYHFMLLEIAGDELHFQTISDLGKTIDSGVIVRRKGDTPNKAANTAVPIRGAARPKQKPTATRP